MLINMKVFYKLIVYFDGFSHLHADKHESLQVDSVFLMGLARHAQSTWVNL